jgi:ammonia channel protein AmtB
VVSMLLIAFGIRSGLLSATPEASYQQSLWAVLLSLSAGVAAFCIRSDSKEQSTLFGQWEVAGKWYVYAILGALAIRVAGLSIWAMRGRSWAPGPVNEFFARAGESFGSAILALVYFCVVVSAVEEIAADSTRTIGLTRSQGSRRGSSRPLGQEVGSCGSRKHIPSGVSPGPIGGNNEVTRPLRCSRMYSLWGKIAAAKAIVP